MTGLYAIPVAACLITAAVLACHGRRELGWFLFAGSLIALWAIS